MPVFPSILPDRATRAGEDDAICGAEMSDGSVCTRTPEECPYDAHD